MNPLISSCNVAIFLFLYAVICPWFLWVKFCTYFVHFTLKVGDETSAANGKDILKSWCEENITNSEQVHKIPSLHPSNLLKGNLLDLTTNGPVTWMPWLVTLHLCGDLMLIFLFTRWLKETINHGCCGSNILWIFIKTWEKIKTGENVL